MSMRTHIVTASERVFDRHGFTASGMDRLIEAADVSSRTLYKHLGGKTALIAATLEQRHKRFFAALDVDSIDALFRALAEWTAAEGARGCYFLRALADTGDAGPEIHKAVAAYRDELGRLIRRLVRGDGGTACQAETIHLLFEGAVTTASYRGVAAIDAARQAAVALLKAQRPTET